MHKRSAQLYVLALSLVWLSSLAMFAHNSPSSAVMLDIHRNGVLAELMLPLEEL